MRFIPLLAATLLICASDVGAAQTLIRLGVAQSSIGTLPLLVAETKGFYAAENVEIETYQFRGGAPAVRALASGSIDICICAGDHAVRLRSRGLPAKIIAGLTERHGYAVLALAGSDVRDLGGLRGGTLGITSPGSLTDNSVRHAFSEIGLDPNRDVTLASVGVGIAMRAALDSGSVDAGMFTTPDVQAVLAESGKYRLIHDFRELNYTALDLIALESFLADNPEPVRALLRAVIRAQNLINSDVDALREAVHAMYPTFDAPLVEQLVADIPVALASAGQVSETGYATMISILSADEPELSEVSFADVVTRAYLPVR